MSDIADDLVYLIAALGGEMILTLLALVVLFVVVLAVRDGLAQRT